MRKFAIVLSALAAVLFVSGTAHAQGFSSSSVFIGGNGVGVGFSSHSGWYGGRRTSVDIHIGTPGGYIGVHSGRGGWHHRQFPPVYGPLPPRAFPPVVQPPCGYDYGCGPRVAPSIQVVVNETYIDRWGYVRLTGRRVYVTAYFDPACDAYVYYEHGRRVIVRNW